AGTAMWSAVSQPGLPHASIRIGTFGLPPLCSTTRPTSAPVGDVRSRVVIDVAVLQIVLRVLTGWLERREREAIAYLTEERTGFPDVSWARGGSGSRTPTGVDWRLVRTGPAARPCGRSPRSRRPTRCYAGIGN